MNIATMLSYATSYEQISEIFFCMVHCCKHISNDHYGIRNILLTESFMTVICEHFIVLITVLFTLAYHGIVEVVVSWTQPSVV